MAAGKSELGFRRAPAAKAWAMASVMLRGSANKNGTRGMQPLHTGANRPVADARVEARIVARPVEYQQVPLVPRHVAWTEQADMQVRLPCLRRVGSDGVAAVEPEHVTTLCPRRTACERYRRSRSDRLRCP
jgi:hypothetical protein